MFIIAVGRTTNTIRLTDETFKPLRMIEPDTNTMPDTTVPTKVMIGSFKLLCFIVRNKQYVIKAATGLSIMDNICPPGKVVVSAERMPARTPVVTAVLGSGLRYIARIIIAKRKSGLMPPKNEIPGISACNTTPTDNNKHEITKDLVFIKDPPVKIKTKKPLAKEQVVAVPSLKILN